ncbi:MAG: hypothetical protein RLZZ608_1019, partial [Actinomycetota bacterium]
MLVERSGRGVLELIEQELNSSGALSARLLCESREAENLGERVAVDANDRQVTRNADSQLTRRNRDADRDLVTASEDRRGTCSRVSQHGKPDR